MQHKQAFLSRGAIIGLIAGVIVIGTGLLMTKTIPAPQKPIEKELDAKAFFESKPQ